MDVDRTERAVDRPRVQWSVGVGRRSAFPSRRRDQDDSDHEPDRAGDHQDHAHGLQVDARNLGGHGEVQNRAHRDEEQGGADGHEP
jgi:hypothetical protein